ncbi:M61 family metallopeptidase [Colwellia psychrerythraea]|uniref:Putative peptidase, M61 family n=1 Tax=Colwellia psychrerythraea (strain 34H / ATCC BAA-681) TaxID=167879 RepID=Q47YB2_COLP3|nr:PDZ domain-containing protein [Colwellia psychrerythraea]AAZ25897.1 putative peptidase, M61 family [Colwellia psychrerythraea 34H]
MSEFTRVFNYKIKLIIAISLFFTQLISANASVEVNISVEQPEHHLANVELKFEQVNESKVNFYLPTWRTGRYETLNLANGIREFIAQDSQGNVLSWHKIDKNTWQVSDAKNKKITLTYQVYANQLAKRTRHIDDSHAFLDSSAVVMYSQASRSSEHIVQLSVPKLWKSFSGLESGNNSHQFIAHDYDQLVDSPIESGINEHYQFSVDNRQYELVIWGEGNYDSAKMVKDLQILVKQSKHVWQGYPFKRYVFMVHATSGARGATEHVNSTIIQRSRFKFSTRKDYLSFIAVAAHEFVHTWNVKQYRPKGIVPYDYQQENYSNLLWLVEGSTSYLQYQLLLRGNLMTTDEFFTALAKRITAHAHKPGKESQSVAQASFDAWISEGGDYGNNHSVNIYSEGFLASWLLDFDILAKTALSKSYRNAHNQLYQQHRLPKGYDEQDVLSILEQITGDDYQVWWQKNIQGTTKINFNRLLAKAGLKMSYAKNVKDKSSEQSKVWTGLKTKLDNHDLIVSSVEKNSPAWDAGLTTEDVIVAIDGLRLLDNELDNRLKDFKPKQTITVTYFRRDKLITSRLKLAAIPKNKLKIIPIAKASVEQKAFFKAWMGVDFPEKK